ncbi:hypothetical protein [Cryptosporangium minutisporangium]|uniref:Uncharacterized protein n=1 Tax=Cryptosporangium minutisporangium TaxID=113569 RepID=A0ABP6T0P8_9ACTN
MTKQRWDDDDNLFADLAEVVRETGPIAQRVALHAQHLFSWRTVDDDLHVAGLVFDSDVEQDALSTMRAGPGDVRVLVFDAARLSVELEVASDQIIGQLIPPGPAEIFVESEGGALLQLSADDRGLFVMSPLPSNRIRLRCDTTAGRVLTDWVLL